MKDSILVKLMIKFMQFLSFFRHVYSTKSFVIPVILFSCLYNVPKFFELRVGYIKPEKE